MIRRLNKILSRVSRGEKGITGLETAIILIAFVTVASVLAYSVLSAGIFSAERGKTLHTQAFTGGKPDTPACTACHGKDVRGTGRTPTGKTIEAMAASVTPARYTDPAKVEKWFKRNCTEVLGRACTAQEKGDWLTFMLGQ